MKQRFLNAPLRFSIFAFLLISFVFVVYGAIEGQKNTANKVVDWLPKGLQETADFDWYVARFHDSGLIMVSWDGCAVDDPTLEKIAERLLTSKSPSLFRKITTSSAILTQMTSGALGLSREEALERMRGWCVSKDGEQGCFIAFLSHEGYADVETALDELRNVTKEIAGISDADFHLAGASADSVAIDKACSAAQSTLRPLFLAVCVVALFWMTKSWLAVFAVFFMAIYNSELTIASMWFAHTKPDSISTLSSSLLFVLTISGALHLLNYYRDNISRNGRRYSVTGALKHALIPCSLACLTTVLGLFSLTVSKMVPIQKFGRFSTISLIVGTILFLVAIAAILEQFPIMKWRYQSEEYIDEDDGDMVWDKDGELVVRRRRFRDAPFVFLTKWTPDFVLKFRYPLIIFNITALCFFTFQVPNLQSTITFHGMFPKDSQVLQDYNYLENKIGGLVPIEVVVSVPRASNPDASPLQQLSLLSDVENVALNVEGVESSLSALNFTPYLPEEGLSSFRALSARSVFNKAVEARFNQLNEGGLYDDSEIPEDVGYGAVPAYRWRLSLRVAAGSNIEYGTLLRSLRKAITDEIEARETEYDLKDTTALITGGVPLAHKAQSQLLDDLAKSYISSFALILITLIILLRNVVAGCLAMLPNIFPSAIVFGFMALLKIPVDMGSMMTASVALGISVDGTIHFINWYHQAMNEGKSPEDAVRFAYRQCSAAMVETTIICGGGMLVFAFSSFLPMARFAWLMAILLTISLYADLILFPPMLVGFLGRFCRPNQLRKKERIAKRESKKNKKATASSEDYNVISDSKQLTKEDAHY